MIEVNGKSISWSPEITFSEIFRQIGYTISNPRVLVRLDGVNIPKSERKDFKIPDSVKIEVVNTLCGG